MKKWELYVIADVIESIIQAGKFGVLTVALAISAQEIPGSAANIEGIKVKSDTGYVILERKPHERIWQRVRETQIEDGGATKLTNSYVEVATGLHVWSNESSAWVDASDEIVLTEEGAAAAKAQHRVFFAGDLNEERGAIDLVAPDGKRLLSRVTGVAYTERTTGQSLFIGEVQASQGFVIGRNQVIYLDGFDGLKADVRYTTTLSSFEQDIILREQLPDPAVYGLEAKSTMVEVWTEFLEAPRPHREVRVVERAEGEFGSDEFLSFGAMTMAAGRAFSLTEDADLRQRTAGPPGMPQIGKSWVQIEGRTFLIEAVPFTEINVLARKLPARQAAKGANFRSLARVSRAGSRQLPQGSGNRAIARSSQQPPVRLARLEDRPRPGVVLDYIAVNGTFTNYTFTSGTTYFISGAVNLSSVTTLEGGAVLKYGKTGTEAVYNTGPVITQASAYQPVILTAMDDDSVGEKINNSTGNPAASLDGYGFTGLAIDSTNSTALAHLRVNYIWQGLRYGSGGIHTLWHSQFGHSIRCAISTAGGADCSFRNVLIHASTNEAITQYSGTLRLEHVTASGASRLRVEPYTTNACYLTNCVIVGVSNISYTSAATSLLNTNNDPSVFQSTGGGNYYLAAGSPYRDAGTSNIHTGLGNDLKRLTTYPPVSITADLTADTILAPVALPDIALPDLGYHYPILDYLAGDRNVTNATLRLTNGVALGIYGTNGLILRNSSSLYSQGKPERLNTLVRYLSIQESAVTGWDPETARSLILVSAPSNDPVVQMRFTRAHLLAASLTRRHFIRGYTGTELINGYTVKHCEFSNTYHEHYAQTTGADMTIDFSNNVFAGSYISFYQISSGYQIFPLIFCQNLVRNGTCSFGFNATGATWAVTDNLFDSVSLSGGTYSFNASNNGYYSTASLGGAGNKTLNQLDFQPGPLGAYYYPGSGTNLASLINAGSQNATDAGLFHFTTLASTNKEGNSTVDIGFHYVAADGTGAPIDSDGDGIPDYSEDANGNGTLESGETSFSSATDLGLKVWITRPRTDSNIP